MSNFGNNVQLLLRYILSALFFFFFPFLISARLFSAVAASSLMVIHLRETFRDVVYQNIREHTSTPAYLPTILMSVLDRSGADNMCTIISVENIQLIRISRTYGCVVTK